jgi:uncharacterized repeat protein (TIGR01451 family)
MNSLFLSMLLTASANAPQQMPVQAQPLSPLLYIKVMGPAGMKVTFYPGSPGARALDAPAVVGVRPGYVYRLQLSLANRPDLKLFPSLEVRGSLHLPIAKAMLYPVPIVFLPEEIERIDRLGGMITKVHYLEDPAQAPAVATKPDEPLALDVPIGADPMEEARARGRIMVVARVGEREPSRDELAHFAVPNTILFPGEQHLALPPAPPQVPWLHVPVYDPIIGARRSNEECLPDGGDVGAMIGIGRDGKVGGLAPSDTALEYTTESGQRQLSVSNRVCLLVPRYAVARQELLPSSQISIVGAGTTISTKTTASVDTPMRAEADIGVKMVTAMQSKQSVHSMDSRVWLHGFDTIKGVQISGTISGVKTAGIVKEPDEIDASPFCQPISLYKWSEPKEAQIGDVVTFFLRYHNHTKESVDNLVISDNLTARLEYIPGSARANREASLTVQANEVGSVILRWELSGKLPPGESGVVAFQVRVR